MSASVTSSHVRASLPFLTDLFFSCWSVTHFRIIGSLSLKIVTNGHRTTAARTQRRPDELHLDEFGYLLRGDQHLQVDPSTLAAIRKLSLQARFAETSGETAEDMLEIEYLMKVMELHDQETQEHVYVRQAREAEVAAYIARQKAEIEAQLDAQANAMGHSRYGSMSAAQSEYPESEYTVYTDTESRYLEVESESEAHPAHVINDPVSEGYAPQRSRKIRDPLADDDEPKASALLLRHASRYHQAASLKDRHSSLATARSGARNVADASPATTLATVWSAARGTDQINGGCRDQQGGSTAASLAQSPAKTSPARRSSVGSRVGPAPDGDFSIVDGRRKKRVPLRTNIAGFSLAKGAAKRLTKNSAKRASEAERGRMSGQEPEDDGVGLDIPCTYLGECGARGKRQQEK